MPVLFMFCSAVSSVPVRKIRGKRNMKIIAFLKNEQVNARVNAVPGLYIFRVSFFLPNTKYGTKDYN